MTLSRCWRPLLLNGVSVFDRDMKRQWLMRITPEPPSDDPFIVVPDSAPPKRRMRMPRTRARSKQMSEDRSRILCSVVLWIRDATAAQHRLKVISGNILFFRVYDPRPRLRWTLETKLLQLFPLCGYQQRVSSLFVCVCVTRSDILRFEDKLSKELDICSDRYSIHTHDTRGSSGLDCSATTTSKNSYPMTHTPIYESSWVGGCFFVVALTKNNCL